MKVFVNGVLKDREQVQELLEPGFLFGWGVFETLRVYNGIPAFLTDHLDRLKRGAQTVFLEYPQIDFKAAISELLAANGLSDAYLRVSLFKQRQSTGVLIYADTFTYYPEEDYKRGYSLIVCPYRRHPQSLYLKVKSISYLESRLAWWHAQQHKKDEAVFLSTDGYVQEGSRSNLFFVKGRRFYTPSVDCGILDGITRHHTLRIIHELGFKCSEGKYTIDKFYKADEVCITSSLMEIMPVCQIDEHRIGTGAAGSLTLSLLREYRRSLPSVPTGK